MIGAVDLRDIGRDFIRTANPINLRSLIGVGDDCGMFISQAITGLAPASEVNFWQQARATTAQLTVARAPAAIQAVTAAMAATAPTDADLTEATDRLLAAFPHEMCITSLGVQGVPDTGAFRPAAVWGPMTQNVGNDCTIGVVTYGGRLRMTAYGLNLGPALLERIASRLGAALQLP